MFAKECVELGHISKAHGLRGELKARFDVHDITEYQKRKSVYLAKAGESLTSFFLESFKIQTNEFATLRFRDINSREAAEALVGSRIYIPLSDLPELGEGRFYYFEIEGFRIVDERLGELGTVKEVVEMPAQDIIVMEYEGKEVMIPITDDFVLLADHEKEQLITHLPDGLLEAYTS
jgi:16S rRNA processing protein RimM